MAEIREKDIRRNFGRVWLAHVAEFTRYLIECRKHFRGDLDMLLLLAVIGDRTLVASKVRKGEVTGTSPNVYRCRCGEEYTV
jgi:hypothetical protein